jgi:hypothetical protein
VQKVHKREVIMRFSGAEGWLAAFFLAARARLMK